MDKVADRKIRWIIHEKPRGRRVSELALIQGITPRRVRQLWRAYRLSHEIPTLREPGRPKKITFSPSNVDLILKATTSSGLTL